MNVVAPFGFFGWGNIGDEATLQGLARLLKRGGTSHRVFVASRDPAHTSRVEPSLKYFKAVGFDPRRWWVKRHADVFVIAGGTPIMDVLGAWPLSEVSTLVRAAAQRGRPIVFLGCGTETLDRVESRRLVADVLGPRVRHWTVRTERDCARLISYGISPARVTATADLGWLLEPVSPEFGRRYLGELGVPSDGPFIGVNVTNEDFVSRRRSDLFDLMAASLDALVERQQARVLFLCNEVREGETFDKAGSTLILSRMRHRERALLVPNRYWSPQHMLSIIAACTLTMSMRYHFCLFSALQGVPFVAIERSDKVADLRWDMQWRYGVSLDEASTEGLVAMGLDIVANRHALVSQLAHTTRRMGERARQNRVALDGLAVPLAPGKIA